MIFKQRMPFKKVELTYGFIENNTSALKNSFIILRIYINRKHMTQILGDTGTSFTICMQIQQGKGYNSLPFFHFQTQITFRSSIASAPLPKNLGTLLG